MTAGDEQVVKDFWIATGGRAAFAMTAGRIGPYNLPSSFKISQEIIKEEGVTDR